MLVFMQDDQYKFNLSNILNILKCRMSSCGLSTLHHVAVAPLSQYSESCTAGARGETDPRPPVLPSSRWPHEVLLFPRAGCSAYPILRRALPCILLVKAALCFGDSKEEVKHIRGSSCHLGHWWSLWLFPGWGGDLRLPPLCAAQTEPQHGSCHSQLCFPCSIPSFTLSQLIFFFPPLISLAHIAPHVRFHLRDGIT